MTWRKREIMEAQAAADQEQGEPVTCDGCNGNGVVGNILDTAECPFCQGTGIDTTPQQRTWVDLTDKDMDEAMEVNKKLTSGDLYYNMNYNQNK